MKKELNPVNFSAVQFSDCFWAPRINRHGDTTLRYAMDKCEETGRNANFDNAAKAIREGTAGQGGHVGIYFDDSDVYKVLEGAGYTLHNHPDAALKADADALIARIAASQWEDGYINSYYTLNAPDQRWTDMEHHEDYCIGHLIEAGVAYYRATGDSQLLDVAKRAAEHMESLFGEGKRHWVVGHQEPELALVKLYHLTGEKKHLDFARFLIEERGHGHGKGRFWDTNIFLNGNIDCQDDKPVREMNRVSGHAVRAMYYYSAVADLARELGEEDYRKVVLNIWDNVANKNMYPTGGIGPDKRNEGFEKDYQLPITDNYCETCAQIGMVYFNHRMNLLTGEAKFADIVELELFNGVLSGMGLDGKHFFYGNLMQSDGEKQRSEWFKCSCCPSNLSRFIPSVGEYFYAVRDNTIVINQFATSTVTLTVDGKPVTLSQQTDYPWGGAVRIIVEGEEGQKVTLKVRMPGWCRSADFHNAELTEDGYFTLETKVGETLDYWMEMPARLITASDRVEDVRGMAAFARGPLVYCFEQADNTAEPTALFLTPDFQAVLHATDFAGGVILLDVVAGQNRMTALPYYLWNNRGNGWMRTWLPLKTDESVLYPGHMRK